MKYKNIIINTLGIFILSFLCHFLYDLLPNFFTSIFFPVNESIWEHVKMLYSAGLFWSIIYYCFKKENNFFLRTYIRCMFLIIILLILYLPAYYIFGEIMVLTIIILLATILITEIIMSILPLKKDYKLLNIISLFLIILNYIIFTYLVYNPIKMDLFFDPENKKYGIDILK